PHLYAHMLYPHPELHSFLHDALPILPQDRSAALEAALTKTFVDKEFLADADKGKLEIAPVSAQQVQKLVTDFLGLSPDLKEIRQDRKSTRLNSSHRTISYAVFCLKKK